MKALHRWQERGLGFAGLIVAIVILGVLLLVGARTMPVLVEYKDVAHAADAAAQEASVVAARQAFDKHAAIDNVRSISSRDLQISRTAGGLVVAYSYDREIALVGPVYLLIKFSGHASHD